MSRKVRSNIILVSTIFALGALSLLLGHHVLSPTKVGAAPGAAPEMLRLQKFYVGTWEYTETYPKGPAAPQGGMNTGVYTSELGPGGNSLINRFHSKGPVGDFEGMLIMTWEPKEKAYKAYIFGNDFPGAIIETGNFEGDTLVFRGEMAMGQTKIALRNSAQLDEKGKMTIDEFMVAGSAPESMVVHVVATRKP
jgi:hypothetical protein